MRVYKDIKPNASYQVCASCQKELVKGNVRINSLASSYFGWPCFDYYHPACFKREALKIVDGSPSDEGR